MRFAGFFVIVARKPVLSTVSSSTTGAYFVTLV